MQEIPELTSFQKKNRVAILSDWTDLIWGDDFLSPTIEKRGHIRGRPNLHRLGMAWAGTKAQVHPIQPGTKSRVDNYMRGGDGA